MSTDTKPKALQLADEYASDGWIAGTRQWCEEAAAELRRLHAENADLRAQLEAIGAGGVEPLRKRQDHVEDDLNMLAADAARYRWLRDPNRPDDSDEEGNFIPGVISGLFICVDESLSEGISGDELDAAIDAAIQAKRAAAGQTDRKEAA